MSNTINFVSIKVASSITGLNQQTLRKLADNNEIESYKTPSGQRKFCKNALDKLINIKDNSKLNFIYSRISSNKSFKQCCEEIEKIKKENPKYKNYTHLLEQHSNNIINTSAFLSIIDSCLNKNIGEVVLPSKEDIMYMFFEFVEILIIKAGGKLTIISDNNVSSEYKELELDKIIKYYKNN